MLRKKETGSSKQAILGGLVLFFCLIFCGTAFAANPTIVKGKVTNYFNNQPIPAASVKILSLSGQLIASSTTDSSGSYQVTVSSGIYGFYLIRASAENAPAVAVTWFLRPGRAYTLDFRLQLNNPPVINSLAPADRSFFGVGSSINIAVSASDPDRNPIQYRYIIDSRVIKDWSVSASFTYATRNQDKGVHTLTVYVRDNKGAMVSRSVRICGLVSIPSL